MGITYKNVNGEGYFKMKGQDEFNKLSQGATGFKTAIPIILGIKNYNLLEKRSKTFIVEEPEINLFPNTQKKLLEFFVISMNDHDHTFIVPTHSPYFLSVLKNLILAYKKGQINKKKTNAIVPENSWLNPSDLSVYELKEGTATSIVDEQTDLIDENIIDDVSDEMSEEFGDLLQIT